MDIQKLIENSKVDIEEAATACFMFFQGVFSGIASKDETIKLAGICDRWATRAEENPEYSSYLDRFTGYQEAFAKHFLGYEKEYLDYARRVEKEFPDSDYMERVKMLVLILQKQEKSSAKWNEIAE